MNKLERADALEAEAKELRRHDSEERLAELRKNPLSIRLVYAADSRCICGAGMAYDPDGEASAEPESPLRRPNAWECSAILCYREASPERQAEIKAATHQGALPFAFYEIKSENQPSASGRTTRPPEAVIA